MQQQFKKIIKLNNITNFKNMKFKNIIVEIKTLKLLCFAFYLKTGVNIKQKREKGGQSGVSLQI